MHSLHRLQQQAFDYLVPTWTLRWLQVVEYWAYCRRRLITSMVVVLFFFYPDLSENVANVFACYPMEFGTYSNGNNGQVRQHCA